MTIKFAMDAKADLLKQIGDLDEKTAQLRRENSEAADEIARIRAAEAEAAGAALLDGAVIAPEKTERRRKEIAKLRQIAEGTAAALEQIPARRLKLLNALALSVPNFTNVALDEISCRRVAGLNKVRAGLAETAEPLAELIASDILEHDLLGPGFAFDPIRHPNIFAGRVVASNFLDALPVRLTPDELDSFAIRARAIEIAARWLTEMKED